MRRFLTLLLTLAALAGGSGGVARAADVTGAIAVIDGDTIDVGGARIRLHGIDAPEAAQTCATDQGVPWACGAWVTEQVRARYARRPARCQPLDKDRHGRIVARCFVDGVDIGQALVADGLAFAYRRYSMDYDLDEKAAAVNDRGLHASRVQSPAAFRKTRGTPDAAASGDCRIKGNISAKGVRIYHLPGQHDYAATRISARKGERWFCSETEARAAGWRRARR